MQKHISAKKIFTGKQILENQEITIEDGVIVSIEPQQTKNPPHEVLAAVVSGLAPAFIDVHINGGEKLYFTQHPTEESIADIYESSKKLGTGYVLPCLITSSHENILKGIESMRSFMEKNPTSGVLGMHLEGPFLNLKKRGAHLAEFVRKPTDFELEEIIKYGKDVIKIVTIAPENFTTKQLQMLLESGITISAGHSDATNKEAQKAFNQGVRLVTHLFNAMSQMGHREVGLVGTTFDNDEVFAPIILDGFHCSYAAARIAHKAKKDKLFLISDALFVGDKVTKFQWGEFDAVLKDGQYRNSEGNLAGAAISMADAVRNAIKHVGIPLQEAIEMATIRPAKAIGLEHKIGKIEVGYPARFVSFDEELDFKIMDFTD